MLTGEFAVSLYFLWSWRILNIGLFFVTDGNNLEYLFRLLPEMRCANKKRRMLNYYRRKIPWREAGLSLSFTPWGCGDLPNHHQDVFKSHFKNGRKTTCANDKKNLYCATVLIIVFLANKGCHLIWIETWPDIHVGSGDKSSVIEPDWVVLTWIYLQNVQSLIAIVDSDPWITGHHCLLHLHTSFHLF